MGLLDKLLGRDDAPADATRPAAPAAVPSADEQAIARYRYMLQTAPPQTIEQAHAEAFAKLTPEQRTMLLQQLANELPPAERAAAPGALKDDPQSLARLATRAEVRQPGTLERSFGGMDGRGMGLGSMMAGSFLSTMAGVVVGSAIANAFFADHGVHDLAQHDPMTDPAAADDAQADHGDHDGQGDYADGGDFDVGGFDEI